MSAVCINIGWLCVYLYVSCVYLYRMAVCISICQLCVSIGRLAFIGCAPSSVERLPPHMASFLPPSSSPPPPPHRVLRPSHCTMYYENITATPYKNSSSQVIHSAPKTEGLGCSLTTRIIQSCCSLFWQCPVVSQPTPVKGSECLTAYAYVNACYRSLLAYVCVC